MNLVTLSQFPKIEIILTYMNNTIILWIEKNKNYKEIIPQIKKMFDIRGLDSIDMFCRNFYIN